MRRAPRAKFYGGALIGHRIAGVCRRNQPAICQLISWSISEAEMIDTIVIEGRILKRTIVFVDKAGDGKRK